MNPKPFDLSTLPRCGAKTRVGTPCKRVGNLRNGRCKLHGGRSPIKHGRYSKAQKANKRFFRQLVRDLRAAMKEY